MFSTREPGPERGTLAEINVTPMVDVMLVLLVIFMITVPVIQSGIQVDVPQTRSTRQLSQNLVVVTVDRSGTVYVDDQFTTFKNLAGLLRQRLQKSSQRDIYVRADEHLPWGTLATVMDAINQTGIGHVNMVTQPYDREPAAPAAGQP